MITLLLKLSVALAIAAGVLRAQAPVQEISIDASAPGHAFPHFWEETFGSGRAILALRDNYRQDLKQVHDSIGMRYVRFHAILHDEVGVYDEDDSGKPVYNFTYVDQIYDGLLDRGVRPFVEISFMPYKLASDSKAIHPFWYKQNVSPPKDYAKWDALMRAFAQHLIDRYGIDEVSQWYFEVWNEPNIDFWAGEPKQSTYFELYDHTARALKAVNQRIRVGGPSSSSAHWVPQFLKHLNDQRVPVDFVSSHGYADDTVQDLFGTNDPVPMRDRLCKAIRKVHEEIGASANPKLPLMWTEWNVPSYGELGARDNWYVGPALARDISQCDGLVTMMSYWTFDDVFEEGGVKQKPFDNGFGLIAPGMIKKPSFYDFALLHKLGEERIANASDDVLVTRRKDGTLVVAAWNLVDMDKVSEAKSSTINLKLTGVAPNAKVAIERVDEKHGNPLRLYASMGSPRYPTQKQVAEMNKASASSAPEEATLKSGQLKLKLPANGLAVIEIKTISK